MIAFAIFASTLDILARFAIAVVYIMGGFFIACILFAGYFIQLFVKGGSR